MNICFKTLKIHNFMSFADAEIKLDNQGYTLVSGVNNCKLDSAKSNGSGKSSIWESIIWTLTGETIRGTKDIINHFGTDGAYTELTFNIDKDEYKIIRYKEYSNIGTNLKIYINGQDKSGKGIRDSEKLLEQYLPDITSDLIGSVIILGQGLPQRFTNNTPSGRKEVLEKLSKSDFMINDIKDKLSKRKTELNEELRKVEDNTLASTSKKQILEQQLVKLNQEKLELTNTSDFDSMILEEEKKLEYLKDQQTDTYNYSQQLKHKLDEKLNAYQNWVAKLHNNYLYETARIDERYNIKGLESQKIEYENKVKYKEDEIKRLESIKDVCPTCGQHLPEVHKVDTTPYKAELTDLKELLKSYSKEFSDISETIEKAKKTIKDKFDKDTEEIRKECQELRETYNSVHKDNEEYVKEITETELNLNKIKLNKQNYETKKDTIDKDVANVENQIKQKDEEILYNNTRKDSIQSHYDVVNKMLTIATRDFRGFLLSEIINFINQKAKEYCKEIFDTEEIEFKLDGNNIFIGYCGKQYENLSGGEKQKIDLIIQFSIRDMLSQFLNFSSNVLVLDEICDNLDYIGCQKVMNLISNKLSDVSSLFIITHHSDELAIPYDNELMIVKDESGISKLG